MYNMFCNFFVVFQFQLLLASVFEQFQNEALYWISIKYLSTFINKITSVFA